LPTSQFGNVGDDVNTVTLQRFGLAKVIDVNAEKRSHSYVNGHVRRASDSQTIPYLFVKGH